MPMALTSANSSVITAVISCGINATELVVHRQHHPGADGVATFRNEDVRPPTSPRSTLTKADLMMVVTIRQHHPGAHGVATP